MGMSMPHSRYVRVIRAARALLDWTQHDLAEKSGVAIATIADFEAGRRKTRPLNVLQLQEAFERAGVRLTLEGVQYINKKKGSNHG